MVIVIRDEDTNSDAVPHNTINANSTREEVLDFIMIFLCERVDLQAPVFKGGYVLTKLIPDEARRTEDIGFSVSEERQYIDLIPILQELGATLMGLGVIEGYEVKSTITPTSSGGIKMCPVDKTSTIKIDIGWHDLSWGVQSWSCEGFNCRRFEVERMLSDKISAIYSRKRFRRTKDLYDFYILTNNFNVSMETVREYIDRRGLIEWDRTPFREDVLIEYSKAYDKLKVFAKDGIPITKPDFEKIIYRLHDFMMRYNLNVTWRHVERDFI